MAIVSAPRHGARGTEAGLTPSGTGEPVGGDRAAHGAGKIAGAGVGPRGAGRPVLVGKGGEVAGDGISREAIITVVKQEN